ncbi:MAG: molybdopterin-binding/glycosyltransferase family 2 protein [Gemmatimonadota bacterium]
MKFGPVPLEEAVGHTLAHGRAVDGRRLPKGTVLGPEEIEALRRADVQEVVVARLDPGDVGEDDAAAAIAGAAAGAGVRVREPFTGRCNLLARGAGVVLVDEEVVDRANRVDESLTLATLPPFAPVGEGRLMATAKVIPMAVPGALLERVVRVLGESDGAVRLAPFRYARAGLVLTELPGTSERLHRKAEEVVGRRLSALGSTLETVRRCPHRPDALAACLAELRREGHTLLLVLGASAVVDRGDVVPGAVEDAGGTVERVGIPVDPGNLLLLGHLDDAPVLGVPGCARSPRRNGFDQVLERVLAGLPVDPDALSRMGVGGLLAEIPSRPQPREGRAPGPDAGSASGSPGAAAIVLAAGSSSRMGSVNKLVARLEGTPLVVHAVENARRAGLDPVVVVTGHGRPEVEAVLADADVELVHNPDAGEGLSTSLRVGLRALEEREPAAVAVCLGDMPRVRPATLRALAGALEADAGPGIVVPVHRRKRGNPVLWAARYLPELAALSGDVGGRDLLRRFPDDVLEVEVDDPGVLADVDTPQALEALRGEGGG